MRDSTQQAEPKPGNQGRQDQGGLTLIRGASVYSPAALGIRDVLIGGGRILALAPRIAFDPVGVTVERIEGDGLLLVPGFVDGLTHLSGGGGEGGFAMRTAPLAADDALATGVTTVIGALGTDDIGRSHAELLASARGLSERGLSAFILTGSYHVPPPTITGSVRGDLLTIDLCIGVGEVAIADHRGTLPTAHELARLAAESRVGALLAGKAGTVLVHVGDAREALSLLHACEQDWAIARRQWHPTHCNRSGALFDHALDWAKGGGSIDFTASSSPALMSSGELSAAQCLKRALAAGVAIDRLTVSSDAQGSLPQFDADNRLVDLQIARPDSLLATLREAVALGLNIDDVLASLTLNPARIWCLPRKGRIAVGADADMLLLAPGGFDLLKVWTGGIAHRPGSQLYQMRSSGTLKSL